MEEYTLYLDETFTYDGSGQNQAFAIGGFIINDNETVCIEERINELKNKVWDDLESPEKIVLHELNVKQALENRRSINELKAEYKRFRRNKNKAFTIYSEMSKIVKECNIVTLGCVVNKDDFEENFSVQLHNEISLVCMQIILENYTHFLYQRNAVGKIVYESRDVQDKTMLMRFYQVSSIGTMYIQPQAIQQRITQFKFIEKSANNSCLQLADFIPNQMARKKTGKKIKSWSKDLTKNILAKTYAGVNNNFARYGIKVIPRTE